MQHYHGEIRDKKALLKEEDLHHFLHVRRAEVGEEIEVSDGSDVYSCLVASLNPLEINVLGKVAESRELDNPITLAFGLLKGDHDELIVQKGTELGISTFIPVLAERCVVKPKGSKDNKLLRLEKIAEESSKQCRRNKAPTVEPYQILEDVLAPAYDRKFFAYEENAGKGISLADACRNLEKGQSVLLLIGPEGGWSEKEVKLALENGCESVSLGRRILRAETACIFASSILSSKSEEKKDELI